jgi:hypothetical protein
MGSGPADYVRFTANSGHIVGAIVMSALCQ